MNAYGIFGMMDPHEVSEGEKPTALIQGVYKFRREPFDTEIEMEEPLGPMGVGRDGKGDNYLFEFFELESFLRIRFKMPETTRGRLLDMLWNFNFVCWDTKRDWIWCPRSDELREVAS